MRRPGYAVSLISLAFLAQAAGYPSQSATFQRVVILKVDGLNEDVLQAVMLQTDPSTGKSALPWFSYIFEENGTILRNFYVRGISLSAPSWSLLDTGRPSVIRGNVEYDRYTGQTFDYLNFFPFYLDYARSREVDMPGVEVLDRAGIPLIRDAFSYDQVFQSFQLFQRGVNWVTLRKALLHGFPRKALFSLVETSEAGSLGTALSREMEATLRSGLGGEKLLYLDFFTGDADHVGHATTDPAAMLRVLKEIDALLGRIWTAIHNGPLARQTLMVVVSDHGMNNVPGIVSQTFSLPDLFSSPEGGGHHVVTNREQLSDFKIKGINPLVHRVVSPSPASLYLRNRASEYPTAWFDLDGNERAAVHLRSNTLNKIQILLQQLALPGLDPPKRKGVADFLAGILAQQKARWSEEAQQMSDELDALKEAIAARKKLLEGMPGKVTAGQRALGEDKSNRRLRGELTDWESEEQGYRRYVSHLKALVHFRPDETHRFDGNVTELVPPMVLGDNNSVSDVSHYVVGPSPAGLVIDSKGLLDEQRSFQFVDYFPLLMGQVVKNNPQSRLSSRPIDFIAMPLPDAGDTPNLQHAFWLYAGEESELVILQDASARLRLQPVRNLTQDLAGRVRWDEQSWRSSLPLKLFEDPKLQLPPGVERSTWLSAWHTEQEWLSAVHQCQYSNGIIGITEELSSIAANVMGRPGTTHVLLRYERRRRALVEPDFHVFAADHWNFNVRFPNPGGNHGSFLRSSTHSVWMMAGQGIPHCQIDQPYDSLNFASTILNLAGRKPPMPERVVTLP